MIVIQQPSAGATQFLVATEGDQGDGGIKGGAGRAHVGFKASHEDRGKAPRYS